MLSFFENPNHITKLSAGGGEGVDTSVLVRASLSVPKKTEFSINPREILRCFGTESEVLERVTN